MASIGLSAISAIGHRCLVLSSISELIQIQKRRKKGIDIR